MRLFWTVGDLDISFSTSAPSLRASPSSAAEIFESSFKI